MKPAWKRAKVSSSFSNLVIQKNLIVYCPLKRPYSHNPKYHYLLLLSSSNHKSPITKDFLLMMFSSNFGKSRATFNKPSNFQSWESLQIWVSIKVLQHLLLRLTPMLTRALLTWLFKTTSITKWAIRRIKVQKLASSLSTMASSAKVVTQAFEESSNITRKCSLIQVTTCKLKWNTLVKMRNLQRVMIRILKNKGLF